ncbi:MAG: methyl-accepting chemotaxis protein [Pirellulaceae bacterium]|nr:methyl-accepting chemotaxis protein [Pirellulaceae bacterium]
MNLGTGFTSVPVTDYALPSMATHPVDLHPISSFRLPGSLPTFNPSAVAEILPTEDPPTANRHPRPDSDSSHLDSDVSAVPYHAQDATTTHVNELAAVALVLQALKQQLHGASRDVEESVAGVCSGFQGMAKRAQAAVASAQSATIGSADSDEVNPLDEMHQVLEVLLKAVQSSCSFSQAAAERLSQLEKRLTDLEKIVHEVEDIAGRAKMVALNGRIEASRLGIAGKAFGVVAQETKDLADKAGKTGCSIRQSINELAIELFKTTAEMRRRAESDSKNVEATNSAVQKLLSRLEQTHHQMNAAMNSTASISTELQNDIGRAVMSMQFQDRVSQRVAHVVETLTSVVELIDPWCSEATAREVQRHYEFWNTRMSALYTMDSERDAGQATKLSSGEPEESHSVELF